MLTVSVPLLLCCVVAHRAESGHQRAQNTVMMDLISTIEVSLAQLKHESNLELESASRSASGGTTLANAPSPPPTLQGNTRANYFDIGTKTIAEMNTIQLRCDSAKQQHRHHGCTGCQRREANSSRYSIERSSSFSISVLASSAESTSRLWVRTSVGEVCVHDSPTRCLYDDSATLENGLSVMSQVQSQHQRWDTRRTGQLHLRGTDPCLG
jgi:hypothetical protein